MMLARMASAPVDTRKNPYRLRKFDPVRHVSVEEMSEPIRWQPPVSGQEPTRMAGIPRTKPSIASTISLLLAMEQGLALEPFEIAGYGLGYTETDNNFAES